ncbi:hypothetical protein [Halobaculum gomorrense]|uniref:Uncharacterized protein n=1 Tax=Halobaculum gomorrense TaxID=43928 RepID=A0A1M5NPI0_9EURY|nr:hypothetical protein [Halobaculum gomorrense]SHG91099.1 hypothetical protein SAMN05443636_1293 [Halobaculum gomorrense]
MHDGDEGGDPANRGEEDDQTVRELVEYCRVQAGLLAGRVETMAEEATDRIDEIDEGIAALRNDLDVTDEDDGDAGPADATGPADADGSTDGNVAALVDAEEDLQRKQTMVEATESRMRLFQELATDYLELADDLVAELDADRADSDEAVARVVSFERERDAHAYFEERETLVEVAAGGEEAGDSTAGRDGEDSGS